ncbi:MAG: hypothetical protein LBN95_01530 [Prevotellaceae bacterium]|jgi:hypothetical protein|nr:hypothetical protein [Prevotellaceae bacterium]
MSKKASTLKTKHQPISINSWLVTFLLLTIPVFNIYMLIHYAFIQKISRTKQNFARSLFVYSAILILVFILIVIIFQIDLAETFSKIVHSFSTIPIEEEITTPNESYMFE